MSRLIWILVPVALAACVGCGRSGNAAMRMPGMDNRAAAAPAGEAGSAPVHQITMPHDEPMAPPGAGRDVFVASCIVCHSLRYITHQPPLTRTTWNGIVQKMIHNYGAHVTDAHAVEIVNYLVATKGANEIGGSRE